MLEFLRALKKEYAPTLVVNMGDEIDSHALSRHPRDPDLFSGGDEGEAAALYVRELEEIFPKMVLLESNHGSRLYRRALEAGISSRWLKGPNEALGVGKGWLWVADLTLDLPGGEQMYLHHGKKANVRTLAEVEGKCAAQGHYHERFKIEYWSHSSGMRWGMQTGCLVDDSSRAFAYNKGNANRPCLGLGFVLEGHPLLIPYGLTKSGRWNKIV